MAIHLHSLVAKAIILGTFKNYIFQGMVKNYMQKNMLLFMFP